MPRILTLGIALLAFVAPAPAAELEKYLPDHTLIALNVNFKQLLNAPLVHSDEKSFTDMMDEATKALADFGLDPAKDLDRIVLAIGDPMAAKNVVALIQGRFDPAKAVAKLLEVAQQSSGVLKADKAGDATLFKVDIPKGKLPNPAIPRQFVFAFLDETTIALSSDRQAVLDALAKRAGRKAEVPAKVLELLGKIDPKQTLSVVAVPTAKLLAGTSVPGLSTITGGLTVADDVKTDVILTTTDPATAKELAKGINDGIQQIKLFLPAVTAPGFGPAQQAILKDVIDTISAAIQPGGVAVHSHITKEMINKGMKKDS